MRFLPRLSRGALGRALLGPANELHVARARPRAARTIAGIGLVLTSVTAGYALSTSAWIPARAFARLT